MSTWKRILTWKRSGQRIGVAALIITVGLAGIGGTSTTAASQQRDAPVKVTFFASPDPIITNLDTNWYTKYVEKKFNMQITWETVPASDVATKSTVLLESGNYPEVFYNGNFSQSQTLKYAQQGILVPMETYFERYAPNVWHAILTEPGLKQALTAPDGHIYGLPNYNVCLHCYYSAKFWMDVLKLKQYGLSMPKTTADFEHVLMVFKQHGLTPLTGAIDAGSTGGWHSDPVTYLMNSFIYDDGGPAYGGNYVYIDNSGKVAFAPITAQWKQGLEYIHKLYSEGLIDQGALSQANSILEKEVTNDTVGVVPWGCMLCFDTNYPKHVDKWRAMTPLIGPNGIHYAGFFGNGPASGGLVFAVTNKATDAQKIAVSRMLNDIWSINGMSLMQFGPAGDGLWDHAAKGVTAMDGQPATQEVNTIKLNTPNLKENFSWYQMGPMFVNYQYRYGAQKAYPPYAPGGLGAESALQLETELNYVGLQPRFVVPAGLWIDPSGAVQYSLEQTNIGNYISQWDAQFINGSKSLDTDWNTFVQGVQGLGLTSFIQATQKAMGKPMDTSVGTLFKKDQKGIKFLQSLK